MLKPSQAIPIIIITMRYILLPMYHTSSTIQRNVGNQGSLLATSSTHDSELFVLQIDPQGNIPTPTQISKRP
jgi:hypothetical protein